MTTGQAPVPQQLHMIWPQTRPQGPASFPVPDGYTLRPIGEGETAAYVRLMQRAGFTNWDETKAQAVFNTMYSDALFMIVHDATGNLVSTAVAQNHPIEHHPGGGEMGWVATDPDHRGKGLSYIAVSLATRRLLAEGHASVYLRTDDVRLPAIRVYLKLGYVPFLYLPDMAQRWQAVCTALGVNYAGIQTTADPAGRDVASTM